eukprot:Phypoly_transcript_04117.p1 GENE.Phypoly_transcript_04117~~Phypoly_transcript_04117.p1  ORF type:complete len:608 (+),score=68.67 Phypoly_transcript_04117:408-2231(+)
MKRRMIMEGVAMRILKRLEMQELAWHVVSLALQSERVIIQNLFNNKKSVNSTSRIAKICVVVIRSMEDLKQTIQRILAPGGGNDLIISFCNFGFIDFILNLVSCFTKLNIRNYLIFSLDNKSHEALQKKGIATYLFEKKEAVYTEETSNFGEVGFKAICNEKPFLVLQIVKLGFNVLWTDSDIVWLENAMEYMKGDYDLFVQRDDDDICAGFFYIKSNPVSILFMTKVVEYLNPMIDDQISMRRFLKEKHGLRHYKLDRILFPNGTAYFNMKLTQKANKTPVIVHNNCIIGHDSKKDRFKLYGLWFVDDAIPTIQGDNVENIPIMESIKILKGHHDVVTTIHVIDNSLYSASLDKNIVFWDLEAGTKIATKPVHPRGAVWGLASLKSHLFSASHDRTCQSWDLAEWKQLATYTGHSTIVNSVCISQSKNMLFTASDDQSIRGYDLETGVKKKIYTGHTGWVSAVCTDGGVLFSASSDSTARAWEISTGRELVIYQGHTGWVRSVAVHGNTVFTASNDHTIRCWNMRDGTTTQVLQGHKAGVSCVCVNNRMLYSGSDDMTIRAWDIETGACLAVYQGHTGWITALTITGKALISSSFDKTIRVWLCVK